MGDDAFKEEIESAAARVMETLSAAGGSKTAWDLKMGLKVPHTTLHLALGVLLSRGKIGLRPENLTFVVTPQNVAAERCSEAS